MTDRSRILDEYLHTIKRLEPDISHVDASAYGASIAISAKRIADLLESHLSIQEQILAELKQLNLNTQPTMRG